MLLRRRYCPDLWSVFRTHHGSRIVCMSHTLSVTLSVDTGESKRRMVPAVSGESRSISLVWGTHAGKLKTATGCESRVLGS